MDTPVSSRTRRNGGPLAHFDVLDGLRGVAALLVLLGHETAIVFGTSGSLAPRKELAVAFFFMLSGFVISSAYEDHLRRGMPATDFLARRVIRLYPLIALGIAVGSLAWIVEGARLRPSWLLLHRSRPAGAPFTSDRFLVRQLPDQSSGVVPLFRDACLHSVLSVQAIQPVSVHLHSDEPAVLHAGRLGVVRSRDPDGIFRRSGGLLLLHRSALLARA